MSSNPFGSKSKSKSSNDPWAPFADFITGKADGSEPGIPGEALDLYRQSGFNPQMQAGNDFYTNFIANQATDPRLNDFSQAGFDLLGGARKVADGAYDSNFDPVGMVNMNQQRAAMGELDPTAAFKELLSGRPDNQYLDQTAAALASNLTRNTNENVMPGLRSSAAVSGQYGGSRQGIAEGLAASRLNQDIALPVSQMYAGALESAKNRMQGTSQYLNDSAQSTAFGNANLGLQNNSQLMQKNSQNLDNRMQSMPIAQNGFGLLTGVNDLQGQNYQNYLTSLMAPQNTNWQNLNNYANLMYQGAGLGGTSKGTQTSSPGIIPSILGTAAGIGGIASGVGKLGSLGSMFK